MSRLPILPLAALCALTAGPVLAENLTDGTRIRDEDTARLESLDRATGAALRAALGNGSPQQAADAAEALRGPAQPADSVNLKALAGDWSCKMTKIGGNLPSVTYPPFRCRIGADGAFAKLTGSQRTAGKLHRDGDAWVYLGSTTVNDDPPRPYADFPDQVDTAASETLPDVAVFEATGANTARLLFPLPYRESVLNVLTLSR